jgi:hypothetical protein
MRNKLLTSENLVKNLEEKLAISQIFNRDIEAHLSRMQNRCLALEVELVELKKNSAKNT